MLEASVTATYLLGKSDEVILDYRKCSYKDRLRILEDLETGSAFYETKAGQRLARSVKEKLQFEGFSRSDFSEQRERRWRIQGKSFRDIFSEVEHTDLYPSTYGMMSESIHGSWNESMDWCLSRNEDGTFSALPFYHPADIRYVTPALKFMNTPYRLWLQRIGAYDDSKAALLNWIERVNGALYHKFDALFDE